MLAATLGGCGSRGRDLLRQKKQKSWAERCSVAAYAGGAAPRAPGGTQLRQRARGVVSLHVRTLARDGRMTVTIGTAGIAGRAHRGGGVAARGARAAVRADAARECAHCQPRRPRQGARLDLPARSFRAHIRSYSLL